MANRVKKFFGSLMDGSAMAMRNQAKFNPMLGVPITKDVVIELVCFGAMNSDVQVRGFYLRIIHVTY